MAADVYDQLANAVQAAYAEKEVSEEARAEKIRQAFHRSGHAELWQRLQAPRQQQPDKPHK